MVRCAPMPTRARRSKGCGNGTPSDVDRVRAKSVRCPSRSRRGRGRAAGDRRRRYRPVLVGASRPQQQSAHGESACYKRDIATPSSDDGSQLPGPMSILEVPAGAAGIAIPALSGLDTTVNRVRERQRALADWTEQRGSGRIGIAGNDGLFGQEAPHVFCFGEGATRSRKGGALRKAVPVYAERNTEGVNILGSAI
jgi:hypothetical protein